MFARKQDRKRLRAGRKYKAVGNNRWGREETYRWPSSKPVWTIGFFVVWGLTVICLVWLDYYRDWTPLQKYWYPIYLKMQFNTALGAKTSHCRILDVEDRKGHRRLAVDQDVAAWDKPLPKGYTVPLILSEEAIRQNLRLVLEPRAEYKNKELGDYVRHWIFHDQTFMDYIRGPLESSAILLLWFPFAMSQDYKRMRIRKYGRRTKGPELVSAAEFNRRNRSDGIGFITKERRTFWEFLFRYEGGILRIPRERESSHVMSIGDTGTGKSSLIRQILMQVEQRGDTAIVYDPALEYTPQFYDPNRGDVILNPVDARMPYWSPCDEVRHEAEAEGLAAALFKDEPRSNPFFVTVPRQIFAHLLTEKPKRTPQELLTVLRDERELTRILKGTEHEAAIYPEAGPQRGGMIATLNSVSNALKLLPRKEEARTTWTALEWSQRRQGWLFITSPPEFRERLRPLISMWLDMLVLRTMNQGKPGVRPVWFVLDELQSLHMLPQLHTAITENRKAANPLVLGFQGKSQLEELYGHKAEAMLSQAATQIFLRTKEANSSEWISRTIGKVEIERLKESRMEGHFPHDRRESRSYQLERTVEPLVMDSEMQGLPNLCAYVKSGNLVVRLSFPYIELPQRHEAFIARKIAPQQLKEEAKDGSESGKTDGEFKLSEPASRQRGLPPIPPQREEGAKPVRAAKANADDLPFLE